jgi:sialate O-acetylesterase
MSPDAFQAPLLAKYRQEYEENLKKGPQMYADFIRGFEEWKARSDKSLAEGHGVAPGVPFTPHEFQDGSYPCNVYNAGIAPLTGMTTRGVAWYQGESNSNAPEEYATLLPAMIRDWRNHWQDPNLAFMVVQLPNISDPSGSPQEDSDWPRFREAQARTVAKTAHTGLAVTIDVGEAHDIHPHNKKDVGYRLAMAALGVEYGQDIECYGPVYKSMKVEGDKIRLTFTHIGGGLVAKAADPQDAPPAGSQLRRFAIAGEDRKFYHANAKIDGDTVVVWSDQVPKPLAVRYAWNPNPAGCNLTNKSALPAVPFRTDNWEYKK